MSDKLPSIAIIAGGLATRLRPLTVTLPKSMLPVAGEPFIAHQLRSLVRQGITGMVLCCGYLGEQIQEFVGDGSKFGCQVQYSFDGDKLKGTGGALQQALPMLGDPFMVIYGDSYLLTPFRPVYEKFCGLDVDGLMTIFRNENLWDTSNVEFRDGEIVNYDKRNRTAAMRHIDYGLGILRRAAFAPWEEQAVFDLASVYERLVSLGRLGGYEVNERFYEIGSHEGLDETGALLQALAENENTQTT